MRCFLEFVVVCRFVSLLLVRSSCCVVRCSLSSLLVGSWVFVVGSGLRYFVSCLLLLVVR